MIILGKGDLAAQQASMSQDIRALWGLQQGGGLRVLFGDQSPNEIALNLAYFEKLLEERKGAIDAFRSLLIKVANNAKAIRETQAELARQGEALEKERRAAAELQEERHFALAEIERSLGDDAARMAQLKADRARLTGLLDELQRSLAELDTPISYKPLPKPEAKWFSPPKDDPTIASAQPATGETCAGEAG